MSRARSAATKARATSWLIVSHGVDGAPGVAVRHAAALAGLVADVDIRVACLRGQPSVEEASADLGEDAVILPLLMAKGYTFDRVVERLPERLRHRVVEPLGCHPELVRLIESEVADLVAARGWAAQATRLLLVGHGTTRHDASDGTVLGYVEKAARWGFRDVGPAFLDAPPFLADVVAGCTEGHVVAVGCFIDPGPHGIDDVEAGLAPLGCRAAYTGPIGAGTAIPGLMLELLRGG